MRRKPFEISGMIAPESLTARGPGCFDIEQAWLEEAQRLEKSAGADNPKVARVLNNIGNVYIATGDYTKALDSHRQAHAIFESKLGPYNDVTLLSQGNIAKTYMASGDAAA